MWVKFNVKSQIWKEYFQIVIIIRTYRVIEKVLPVGSSMVGCSSWFLVSISLDIMIDNIEKLFRNWWMSFILRQPKFILSEERLVRFPTDRLDVFKATDDISDKLLLFNGRVSQKNIN